MSLTPISRDAMLSLKAQKDEEIRQKAEAGRQRRIIDIVTNIYNSAKTVAETTAQKSYSYAIPDQFHITCIEDLLASLRGLFPGCTIAHTVRSFATGVDGKEHDVTTGAAHIFPILRQRREEVIVVDWS